MYQVNLGAKVLYYPASEDAAIYDTEWTEDIGQAGEFSFKVPPSNPLYAELTQGALVTILKNNVEVWRGEIREISKDFANIADVYCLEDMAWLADEFLTPASITNETYVQRFQAAITAYNLNRPLERQFTVGYITSANPNGTCNWQTEYEDSILDDLRNCICKDDGYIRVRRVTSGGTVTRFIDIVRLADYGVMATQPIEYGYNLLDYVKESDYGNLTNVLTPFGEETNTEIYDGYNQRVAGTPIEDNASIQVYGRHAKTVVFDGVTDVAQLNALAQAYLTRYSQPQLTMEVKAVDLSEVDGVAEMHIGDSIRIIARPFAIDQWLYLTEIRRDLQNIDKNTITLSGHVQTRRTITDQTIGVADTVKNLPSKSSILDAAFKNVLALLNGVDGGYVTFETDGTDHITEIRIANNMDFEQATNCWRWNLGGLAHLHRDYPTDDWTVNVAMDMTGQMTANFIKTGELIANNGVFELNMETGNVTMQQGTFGGSLNAATGTFKGSLNAADGTFSGTVSAGEITGATKFSVSAKGADGRHNSTLNWGESWEDSLTLVTTSNKVAGIGVNRNNDRNQAVYMHYDNIEWYDNSSTPEQAVFEPTSSDIRLKENIEDLDYKTIEELFTSIHPVKFDYIDGKKNQYGLIAQELIDVLDKLDIDESQIIKTDNEGFYQIRYSKLYRLSMLATHDLYKRIEKLEKEINKLKGESNGRH